MQSSSASRSASQSTGVGTLTPGASESTGVGTLIPGVAESTGVGALSPGVPESMGVGTRTPGVAESTGLGALSPGASESTGVGTLSPGVSKVLSTMVDFDPAQESNKFQMPTAANLSTGAQEPISLSSYAPDFLAMQMSTESSNSGMNSNGTGSFSSTDDASANGTSHHSRQHSRQHGREPSIRKACELLCASRQLAFVPDYFLSPKATLMEISLLMLRSLEGRKDLEGKAVEEVWFSAVFLFSKLIN